MVVLVCDKRRILCAAKVLCRKLRWPEYEFDQLGRCATIFLTTEVVLTIVFAQIVDRDQGRISLVVVMKSMLMVPVATLIRFGFAIVIANRG